MPELAGAPAQEFLAANGLRLIIRSHEGPDARSDRADLPGMGQGFAIDHVTPAGRLVTVFSAPDYTQFQARRDVSCSSYKNSSLTTNCQTLVQVLTRNKATG